MPTTNKNRKTNNNEGKNGDRGAKQHIRTSICTLEATNDDTADAEGVNENQEEE